MKLNKNNVFTAVTDQNNSCGEANVSCTRTVVANASSGAAVKRKLFVVNNYALVQTDNRKFKKNNNFEPNNQITVVSPAFTFTQLFLTSSCDSSSLLANTLGCITATYRAASVRFVRTGFAQNKGSNFLFNAIICLRLLTHLSLI